MNIQTILEEILRSVNSTVIPLLIAIALLTFLFNIVRYFIIGGANEESQEKARSLALWGILAFIIITSMWGIVNLVVHIFGFGNPNSILPDYMCKKILDGDACQEESIDNVLYTGDGPSPEEINNDQNARTS